MKQSKIRLLKKIDYYKKHSKNIEVVQKGDYWEHNMYSFMSECVVSNVRITIVSF